MIHNLLHRFILTIILLLALCNVHTVYALGEWQIYNSTTSFVQGQIFNGRIYAIAGTSLCSFDMNDGHGYLEYNRISGLSSSSVSLIQTTRDSAYLCIAYSDGNIDLLDQHGRIWNMPDLLNKSLTESKEPHSIIEGDDGILYLSGQYGMLCIDPKQKMIIHSIQSRKDIDFSFSLGGYLFRCSKTGIIERTQSTANVSDQKQWIEVETDDEAFHVTDLKLFLSDGSYHCWLIGADGLLYELMPDASLTHIGGIELCTAIHPLRDLVLVSGSGYLALTDPAHPSFAICKREPFISCTDYFSDQDSAFYAMHSYYGFMPCSISECTPGASFVVETDLDDNYVSEGIATYYLSSLQITPEHEVVGVARRSAISGYTAATALGGCVSRFSMADDQWFNIPVQNIVSKLDYRPSFNGLTSLAIDPTNHHRYAVGSWLFGLYIIDNDTLLYRYDELNSEGGVQAFDPTFSSTRVSAVAYDDEGRLYFTNSMQDTVLCCLTPDGRFFKYPNPGLSQVADASRILLPQYSDIGLKWVLNDYGYQHSRIGIYYDQNIAPEHLFTTNYTEKQYQTTWFNTLVDQDQNEYLPNYIYDLCEDRDGSIWVLTNIGPFVIEDPVTTFNYAQQNVGRGRVRRIKIPRNDGTNLADYLMVSTPCTCMAVDKYNRKWIGTNGSGVYLLSADCITEIQHFTAENSPLLSDDILSLAYDEQSGLLFISCEGGVLTYQTDAIEGADDFSSLYCYPNPVRPEYSGELRIMGLMDDSTVSITDATGNLIYRTQSLGTTAVWDLRGNDGSRVAPGVYLIHGISADGSQGNIIKVLVM